MSNNTTPLLTQIQPGVQLRHYKGGLYTVEALCRIEATLKTGVLYRSHLGDSQEVLWLRPLDEFSDRVMTQEGEVPRFTLVSS